MLDDQHAKLQGQCLCWTFVTYSKEGKASVQMLERGLLMSCVWPLQAETELMGTLSLLGRSKAARVLKEQELEGSLNELERLKNTLIASTRELAGSRAANDATR